MSIVWLDLETTGLNAHKCRVLEVGVIITDDSFNELARYHAITDEARRTDYTTTDPYVLNMHAKSGLWCSSIAEGHPLWVVDRALAELVGAYCTDGKPQLGGNTVDFDRSFADVHLPAFASTLHYRSLNVTSLNELARRVWPAVYAARPNNPEPQHRVMADIEESLRVCKFYATALGPILK